MANEEKQKYSAEELKEFEAIIRVKLDDTNAELKYLRAALSKKNDTGTDATSGNSKVMEDGADTAEKENLNQLAVRQQKFAVNLENALMRIKNGTYGVCIDSGKLISKDPAAYTYLPESVQAFPDGPDFITIYESCGFSKTQWIPMTGGICSIYLGQKVIKSCASFEILEPYVWYY